MSQMTTADEIESKRQQLLAALAALPAIGVGLDKPLLRRVQETDSAEWDDETWDFANARLLLSPSQQAEYSVRLMDRQQKAERDRLVADLGGNIPGLGVATRGSFTAAELAAGAVPVPVREGKLDEPPQDDEEPYDNWKVAELRDEVRLRNEQRADDAKLTPASDRKEDLVAALEADDVNS